MCFCVGVRQIINISENDHNTNHDNTFDLKKSFLYDGKSGKIEAKLV